MQAAQQYSTTGTASRTEQNDRRRRGRRGKRPWGREESSTRQHHGQVVAGVRAEVEVEDGKIHQLEGRRRQLARDGDLEASIQGLGRQPFVQHNWELAQQYIWELAQ